MNILDNIFYFLYIIIWKGIIKKIIFIFTRKHEIERIIKEDDDISYTKFIQLSN